MFWSVKLGLISAIKKRDIFTQEHIPITFLYLRRESNSDLKFRKLLFYPLNYRGRPAISGVAGIIPQPVSSGAKVIHFLHSGKFMERFTH